MIDDTSAQVPKEVRAKRARWRRLLRPQFSLKTLMLLAVICALLVALWTSSRRLEQAKRDIDVYRAEIAKYRRELGYLDITDPNKVHAIGLRTTGSLRWQWRIYLPQNRRFRLGLYGIGIPKSGFAGGPNASGDIRSGESLVDACVERGPEGRWLLSTKRDGRGGHSVSIGGKEVPWLDKGANKDIEEVQPEEVKVLEPGEPLVLVRLRVHKPTNVAPDGTVLTTSAPDTPCEGLMIAIEEVK